MNAAKKVCKICGNEFMAKCHNKAYCSEECAIMGRRELDRINRIRAKHKDNKSLSRSEIEAEARKHGMHYGMWVGLKGL
jgi:hypothetical protein